MIRIPTALLGFAVGLLMALPAFGQAEFIRGDANHDGTVSISDAATMELYFFVLDPWTEPSVATNCLDALDTEDDGVPSLIDIVRVFEVLFFGGPFASSKGYPGAYDSPLLFMPAPFPGPGQDPTEGDGLSCEQLAGSAPAQDQSFVVEVGTVQGLPGETVLVPVYATTPVVTDAMSFALTYGPDQLSIEGFTFDGSVYETLVNSPELTWVGDSAGNWQEEGGDNFYDFLHDSYGIPRPQVTPGQYVFGVLNAIGNTALRLPPLNRDIVVKLKVHILSETPGEKLLITPQNGIKPFNRDPGVYNEFSVLGEAVYASIYPRLVGGGAMVLGEEISLRGDANLDHRFDLSDPISVLAYLFQGGPAQKCPNAAEFNQDGTLDISDPVAMLVTLFLAPSSTGLDEIVTCR